MKRRHTNVPFVFTKLATKSSQVYAKKQTISVRKFYKLVNLSSS